MERTFEFEKETKNTIRFSEIDEGEGMMIGNIYIQKDALDDIGWAGENITVKIKLD